MKRRPNSIELSSINKYQDDDDNHFRPSPKKSYSSLKNLENNLESNEDHHHHSGGKPLIKKLNIDNKKKTSTAKELLNKCCSCFKKNSAKK
jgi:NAD+--asparagine ADP-ribosyltransferase